MVANTTATTTTTIDNAANTPTTPPPPPTTTTTTLNNRRKQSTNTMFARLSLFAYCLLLLAQQSIQSIDCAPALSDENYSTQIIAYANYGDEPLDVDSDLVATGKSPAATGIGVKFDPKQFNQNQVSLVENNNKENFQCCKLSNLSQSMIGQNDEIEGDQWQKNTLDNPQINMPEIEQAQQQQPQQQSTQQRQRQFLLKKLLPKIYNFSDAEAESENNDNDNGVDAIISKRIPAQRSKQNQNRNRKLHQHQHQHQKHQKHQKHQNQQQQKQLNRNIRAKNNMIMKFADKIEECMKLTEGLRFRKRSSQSESPAPEDSAIPVIFFGKKLFSPEIEKRNQMPLRLERDQSLKRMCDVSKQFCLCLSS